ncbi:TIGR02757 family protein [Flammeovirga aprica]|uniref:TIGR02757 family protein n=1 Tax=Flammeovirga aprica JL-4 TaxID=694437 RepID=A0A7X9RXR9_9BACT|nr:TIGR02757 family protein [Flammeovirga aprica]NME70712.1 TIGR02757 family protein [Flammeovirga aprica JL-4]
MYELLENSYEKYNQPNFIPDDPICIPHSFSKKEDIEIMGFWAAVLAWGQRKTIINKCKELVTLMDNAPHDFIINHTESDLKPFLNFKHRTFNDVDTLYFLSFFQKHYQKHNSLEDAFLIGYSEKDENVEHSLIAFHDYFFEDEDAPQRTRKHIATPARKSACKRINMFLRWMVRKDDQGVDFGIWNTIQPHQLICPLDVHVERVSRKLKLLTRKQSDWKAAVELTENLKKIDQNDPVKYDFALFGLGLEKFASS